MTVIINFKRPNNPGRENKKILTPGCITVKQWKHKGNEKIL